MRIDHDNVSLLVFHLPSKRSFHFPPLSSRSSPALLHAVGPDSALKLLYGLGSLLPAVPKAVHGLAVSAGDGVQVSKWSLYPRVQADHGDLRLTPLLLLSLALALFLVNLCSWVEHPLAEHEKKRPRGSVENQPGGLRKEFLRAGLGLPRLQSEPVIQRLRISAHQDQVTAPGEAFGRQDGSSVQHIPPVRALVQVLERALFLDFGARAIALQENAF